MTKVQQGAAVNMIEKLICKLSIHLSLKIINCKGRGYKNNLMHLKQLGVSCFACDL